MVKSMRTVPTTTESGQTITFSVAVGPIRQACRLQTTFRTQNQALSYLHRNRTEFETIARARLARGEIEDGVVELVMI
jgi:hypothetical protein